MTRKIKKIDEGIYEVEKDNTQKKEREIVDLSLLQKNIIKLEQEKERLENKIDYFKNLLKEIKKTD